MTAHCTQYSGLGKDPERFSKEPRRDMIVIKFSLAAVSPYRRVPGQQNSSIVALAPADHIRLRRSAASRVR